MPNKTENVIQLNKFLPYRLAKCANHISEAFSVVYTKEFGLTIPQWRILVNLAEYGTVNAKYLGQLAAMDKSTVSRAVLSLQDAGYVIKQADEKDKRAYNLFLSPAGSNLYLKIVPKALAWEENILKGLNENEKSQLFNLLDKLDLAKQD